MLFSHLMLQMKTVKVSNLSLSATEKDIKEFFSFSGDIEHVELKRFVRKKQLPSSLLHIEFEFDCLDI